METTKESIRDQIEDNKGDNKELTRAILSNLSLVSCAHEKGEFSEEMEKVFEPLLVASASIFSFSHGASSVGNSVGPFLSTYSSFEAGAITSSYDVPM